MNAYNNAPDIVRVVFNDEKTTEIIMGVQAEFQLHVDSAGVLGKGVGHMLLGLVSPPELVQKLVAAGIPNASAQQIIAEINQKIFVPLREQVRSGGVGQPPKPAAPQAPRLVSIPVPKYYAPPPQSPAYSHPDNKFAPSPLVSKIAPLPPKVVMPRATEATGAGETLSLDTRNQASVNLITNNRPEIHHELPPTSPTPAVQRSAETPLQQALRTVLPSENLPGAMPPSDIIPPAPKILPPTNSSGVDPYREQIDEN